MITLAVWLSLASVPISDLEVNQLNLTEAMAEDVRLSMPPSRVPYATMLGVGLIALPTGVVSTIFIVDHWRRTGASSSLGRFFNDAVYGSFAVATGIIGAVGLALSIAGGVLLYATSRRADDMELRRALVRDRIRMLEAQERPDPQHLEALEQEILFEQRPAMGFPGGMLGGGIAATVVGLFTGGLGLDTRFWGAVVAGGGEIAIGVAMIAVAIWQFIARSEERDRIDARLNQLQFKGSYRSAPPPPPTDLSPPPPPPPPLPPPPPPPPGASLLPPAPVLVSWGFSF